MHLIVTIRSGKRICAELGHIQKPDTDEYVPNENQYNNLFKII